MREWFIKLQKYYFFDVDNSNVKKYVFEKLKK